MEHKYKVTVKPIEDARSPGAFAGITCDHDFEEFDGDGNEVYTVTAELDIANRLNLSDGVVNYTEL